MKKAIPYILFCLEFVFESLMDQLCEGVKDLHDQDELARVKVFRGRQAEQFHTLTKERYGKCLAESQQFHWHSPHLTKSTCLSLYC